jgi:hypothetical protein
VVGGRRLLNGLQARGSSQDRATHRARQKRGLNPETATPSARPAAFCLWRRRRDGGAPYLKLPVLVKARRRTCPSTASSAAARAGRPCVFGWGLPHLLFCRGPSPFAGPARRTRQRPLSGARRTQSQRSKRPVPDPGKPADLPLVSDVAASHSGCKPMISKHVP